MIDKAAAATFRWIDIPALTRRARRVTDEIDGDTDGVESRCRTTNDPLLNQYFGALIGGNETEEIGHHQLHFMLTRGFDNASRIFYCGSDRLIEEYVLSRLRSCNAVLCVR